MRSLRAAFTFCGRTENTAYSEEIARTQDISTYYTFSGNLSTKDSQIVTSTAKTTVKECLFSEGDTVKKNDIILKFSSGGTAHAPMDGTLSNLYVEEGDEVTIGAAAFARGGLQQSADGVQCG